MKKNNAPVRYAAYLRCSTDDQKEGDFTTIDVQRELNARYVAEKSGELVATYVDEGKSGTTLNRPGWKQLLDDAQRKTFDAVIVTYMSRLGRGNAFVIAEWELSKVNVAVEMVKEKFTDDLAGYMTRSMTNVMDGMYAQMVRSWTKTKMVQMVEQGYCTGGVQPYGFKSEVVPGATPTTLPGGKVKPPPKRLVPDEDAAPIVQRAFALYRETGNMGHALRYLRETVPGRSWSVDTVRRMLTNEKYIGVLRFGEHTNPSAHEPIIAADLWQAVQAKLAAPSRPEQSPDALGYEKKNRADPIAYYLRGKVHCAHCGALMTPAGHYGSGGKVGYYQCPKACKLGAYCPIKRINAHTLHAAVLSEIQRCGEHPTRLKALIREAARLLPPTDDLQAELLRLRRNRRETEKKIARLVAAIREGVSTTSLTNEIASLEALATAQEEKISEAESVLAERSAPRPDAAALGLLWEDFSCQWQRLTEEERSRLLCCLVDSVTMLEKEKGALRLLLCLPEASQDSTYSVGFSDKMGAGDVRVSTFAVASNASPGTQKLQPVSLIRFVAPLGRRRRLTDGCSIDA